MSKLSILSGKTPREVAQVLAAVSKSMLPNPGLEEVILETGSSRDFAESVLKEIRRVLSVSETDYSVATQTRIYTLISDEMSKAAFANVKVDEVKRRLANKGDLHPSKYEIKFNEEFHWCELLGERQSNVAEVVLNPEKFVHLQNQFLYKGEMVRVTISTKTIIPKKSEDKFLLIVVSLRHSDTQYIFISWRLYDSEVRLEKIDSPLEALKTFIDIYGFTMQLGDTRSKFIFNETVAFVDTSKELWRRITVVDGDDSERVAPLLIEKVSTLRGPNNEEIREAGLGFTVNVSKYIATLRKHNVRINSDTENIFVPAGLIRPN